MGLIFFRAEKFYRLAFDYFHYESNISLAKKYANAALKINENHFESLMLLGQIFLVENKTSKAVKYFIEAHKLKPDDENCLAYIACALDLEGNFELSLKYLNKIFKKQIKNKDFLSECYRLKISLLINLNKRKKAEDILKKLNNELYTDDIFYIEKTFKNVLKRGIKTENFIKNNPERKILHINF